MTSFVVLVGVDGPTTKELGDNGANGDDGSGDTGSIFVVISH